MFFCSFKIECLYILCIIFYIQHRVSQFYSLNPNTRRWVEVLCDFNFAGIRRGAYWICRIILMSHSCYEMEMEIRCFDKNSSLAFQSRSEFYLILRFWNFQFEGYFHFIICVKFLIYWILGMVIRNVGDCWNFNYRRFGHVSNYLKKILSCELRGIN